MKNNHRTPLVAALLGSLALSANALPTTSFDDGLEGWTAVNGVRDVVWVATGGDPGGYAMATDNVFGSTIWTWAAPAAYNGDLGAAYGGSLDFSLIDSRDTRGGNGVPDVRIVGAGLTIVVDAGPSPATEWTRYDVALLPGAWHVDTLSGPLATAAQMQAVLADVTALYIRGDFSPLTRNTSSGLDSVALVAAAIPEPATWALWAAGIGCVGAVVRRRR
jgi:hypothetical protein